jgi:hypothetical protein
MTGAKRSSGETSVVMFFQSLARATRWLTQSCANRALEGAAASNETGHPGVPAAGGSSTTGLERPGLGQAFRSCVRLGLAIGQHCFGNQPGADLLHFRERTNCRQRGRHGGMAGEAGVLRQAFKHYPAALGPNQPFRLSRTLGRRKQKVLRAVLAAPGFYVPHGGPDLRPGFSQRHIIGREGPGGNELCFDLREGDEQRRLP